MFNLEDIEKIEIELTTQCQASCPMCSRNFHGLISNPNVKNISWNYKDFKKIINLEVLRHTKVINFCGAYGDPLICRDIEKICSYIKDNSVAELRIHTNGSLHNQKWWNTFVKYLPQQHKLIFAIDGFKENHEKHRIGTSYNKIIDNAKAFIDAGGVAEAQFISFDHNKDDYADLKQHLLNIGFSFVYKIQSDRFRNDTFLILDKNQKEIGKLLPDNNSNVVSFKDTELLEILKKSFESTIVCRSMHKKEIYIDAYKHLYPCCEIAAMRYEIGRLNEPNFNSILPELKNQITKIHKEYNNIGYIDLNKSSIKEIIHDRMYKDIWQKYWDLKQSFVCNVVCGKIDNTKFIDRDSQVSL